MIMTLKISYFCLAWVTKYFIFFDFEGVDTKISSTSTRLTDRRMDQIHKKVLSYKTVVIMQRITNPVILLGYLSTVFTASVKEEIEAKDGQSGPTVDNAIQHLLLALPLWYTS